ncbi:MAG: hypothetical protein RL367_532, partial [Pseudomonadota bacterium]
MPFDKNARGYVIWTYPRSGATWLAELLASTGVLGNPGDWFNGVGLRVQLGSDYPLDREGQFQQVLTRGTTPNGIYGLKMSCFRFGELAGFDWISRLPGLHHVHLVRKDCLARAISDVRAQQTGQYRSNAQVRGVTLYDGPAIQEAMREQAQEQARLKLYFARNGIVPLELTYEAAQQDPGAIADAVAHMLALHDRPILQPD